jgi:sarcosine oxidase subunit delta
MKLVPCPLNGLRPADEFVCGGEVRASPEPSTCSDAQWAQFVFHRSGVPGVKCEWWCHTPSGYWFIAERDTLTDEVLASYPMAQLAAANP